MKIAEALSIVGYLWLAALAVWMVGAFMTKRTSRRQTRESRLAQSTLGILAALFGFSRLFNFGFLARHFLPRGPLLNEIGVALTAAGIALAIWARFALGRNWSGVITVKEGHTLVERGPYRIVRHPIYSGLLLGVIGTALVLDRVRVLVSAALILALFLSKIQIEERFMTQEFGAEYEAYKQRAKALIPFVY